MSKTFIVTKEQLDSEIYELLKLDANRHRATYGKDWPKNAPSGHMTVRCNVRYWIIQHSDDPDDITIEQYKTRYEVYE